MRLVIAFGHKARQGKDTCCEAIEKYYGNRTLMFVKHGMYFKNMPVKRINFADALRREVTEAINKAGSMAEFMAIHQRSDLFPSWVQSDPNPDMTDPLLPHGKHPKILQWWGTEYRRAEDPNYWVDRWLDAVKQHEGIVVTSDMRFQNEALAVNDIKGHTVNVSRVNPNGSAFVDPTRPADHISETELDGFSWDFYLKAVTGQAALLEQYAITLTEYLLALETKDGR